MAGQVISRLTSSGGDDAGVHVISSSFYGTCSTAANESNKEVIIQNRNINSINLVKGMLLTVKFAHGNSVTSELPTLQIFANAANSDSATPVKGTNLTTNILKIFAKANDTMQPEWEPNSVVSFVYDTYYDQTNNETYGCWIKTEASDTVLATKLEQVELTVSQVESATTSLSTGLGNLTNRVDEIGQVAAGAILDADMQYISWPIGTTPSQTPTAGENQWQTIAPEYEYGYYIWQRMATVTAGSVTPSYSDPVCISGRDGADGQPGTAGVSAYQYYLTASPSALINDNGIISPATIVFSASRAQGTETPQGCPAYFVIAEYNNGWSIKYSGNNNGQDSRNYSPTTTAVTLIQCTIYDATETSVQLDTQTVPVITNGKDGQNGTSVTVDHYEYGISDAATTDPTNWSSNYPSSISKGSWLWTKTVYTGTTTPAIIKSYIGTDGEDGNSVTINSINKDNGTTTVVLDNGDGTTSSIIIEDGINGQPGNDSYVHFAWANSADGQNGFTPAQLPNTEYLYMGVYTDNNEEDSEDYQDYTWTLIKGEDGEDSYSILLTNENHTFAATASAAITATVSSEVIAYKGITPTSVTFSSSLNTNPIEGITVTSHNSTSTANAYFTVSVTPGLTTNNKYGVIHIPVIVDGQEFVKDFSWTLAPAGTAGTNAYNRQTVFLYKRSTTTPTAGPSGPLNYTFSTGTITPSSNLNGWSSSFPDGTDPCWVIAGTAAAEASVASDAIETNGWSSPTLYVQNGINGTNGIDAYSQATISLYQRSVSTPAEPTDPLYYTFSTGTLTPANSLGSWTRGITAATNGEPCWIISTNAISDGATYTISDWSDPVIFTVDGIDGNDGAQILGITTAPTTYTTQQGNFTPAYQISLATVKTQSGTSEVKIGDILAYSYYHYPVGYVDSNYVYCGARKSIRGATGTAAYTYNLTCNPAAIVLDTNTTPVAFNPNSVILGATRAQGTGNPAEYQGRFELEYYDGSTWSGVVTSTANESSKNCSIANVTTTATLLRATLYMADGTTTAVDTQTIPILRDGTNGTNGADAYTVILDNENHTFAAENGAAVTATVTSQVYAYKGTTLTSATIGSISGHVTGITASITGNSTTAAAITISASWNNNNLLTTSQGILTIPVTVDGKSFTKKFTWALAKNGLNQATINLYKRATSASKPTSGTATYTFSTKTLTNAPSGWSTTFPQETQGSTTPVWIMSAIASNSTDTDTIEYGEWSTPIKMVSSGSNGDDGYNQASINIYKQSTNQPGNSDLPTEILTHTFSNGANSFGGTAPAVSNGWSTIIPDASTTPTWMRSAIAISTAATDTITTTEWSDPAIKYAQLPKSISSIVEYYQRTNSTTAPQKRSADGGSGTGDNGWGTTISQVDATHKYLWNYEVINYNDNSSDSTAPRIVGTYAKDGTSITITGIEYGQSANVSTEPSTWYNETDWASQSIGTGVWIWVKTTYSNNSVSINKSYVGTNGTNGQPGASSYTHIAWANSSNGQTDFSKTSSTNKTYLGICINNTQSDSSLTYSDYSWSLIQGKSIVSIINKYKTTINAIRPATSDDDWIIPNPPNVNIPTVDSTNKYLWTYEETTYQNPSTTETTQPHLIGAYGDTGISPTSFIEQEILWQHDDSDLNTHPAPGDDDTWTDGEVVWESGKYIWGRTKIIWSDSTEQNPHITYTDPILASGTNKIYQSINCPNLSPFFQSQPWRNSNLYDETYNYWQPTNDNWDINTTTQGTLTFLNDGWAHITVESGKKLEIAIPQIESISAGNMATLLVEWRNVTATNSPSFYARNYPTQCQFNQNSYSITFTSANLNDGEKRILMTANNTFTSTAAWNAAINFGMNNSSGNKSFEGDLRLSLYKDNYEGQWQPYVGDLLYSTQEQNLIQDIILNSVSDEITKTQTNLQNTIVETNQWWFITDRHDEFELTPPNTWEKNNNTGFYDNWVLEIHDPYIIFSSDDLPQRYTVSSDGIVKDTIIKDGNNDRDVTEFCIVESNSETPPVYSIQKYYPYNYYCYEYKFMDGSVDYSSVIYDSVKSSIAKNKLIEEKQNAILEQMITARDQYFYSDENGAHVISPNRENQQYRTDWNTFGTTFFKDEARLLTILATADDEGQYSGLTIYNGKSGVDEYGNELEKTIAKFTPGLIQLGAENDSNRVCIERDRIEFIKDNTPAAYIANSQFYTPNITIDSSLYLETPKNSMDSQNSNDIYRWAWIPRSNGNISFKWVGHVTNN